MKWTAARIVRFARRKAGLTQSALAERVGVPQSMIARIETERVSPRLDTVLNLLRACGRTLELRELAGQGIDRTMIQELRRLTPTERVATAAAAARNLAQFEKALRR